MNQYYHSLLDDATNGVLKMPNDWESVVDILYRTGQDSNGVACQQQT